MRFEQISLEPGLYFVATPIGSARDITLRALDILASADVLAAEDTRTLRRLMQIHGVPVGDRPIVAYHDHNGARVRPGLLARIREGASVAYASEAGSPLVADPGFALAREALGDGLCVTTAPGPSAVIAALTLSGLPTDRFLFAGFAPTGEGARRTWYTELLTVPATVVVYESPKRLSRSLADIEAAGGEMRQVAICREMTKKFEEVRRGTVTELRTALAETALKGEIVLVIGRGDQQASESGIVKALLTARQHLSFKDAVQAVAKAQGVPRRRVYQLALSLEDTTE